MVVFERHRQIIWAFKHGVAMIKVTDSSVADGEVELIVTAARFFLDRLVPAAQQKKLMLNIGVTDKPGRMPIAVKWLIGSS